MLSDSFMQDEINNRIDQGICAEKAVDETCGAFIDMFSSTGDELTMQRATDIKDIRVRLLRILTNTQEQNIGRFHLVIQWLWIEVIQKFHIYIHHIIQL